MAIARKVYSRVFIGLIGGIGSSIGGLLSSSAIAQTPIVFTDSTILSVSFNECKNRAIFAAKSALNEVQIAEERGLRFKITGTTLDTVAVIYCIERSKGTIAIVTTSTYSKDNQQRASSIYNRLTDVMTDN